MMPVSIDGDFSVNDSIELQKVHNSILAAEAKQLTLEPYLDSEVKEAIYHENVFSKPKPNQK